MCASRRRRACEAQRRGTAPSTSRRRRPSASGASSRSSRRGECASSTSWNRNRNRNNFPVSETSSPLALRPRPSASYGTSSAAPLFPRGGRSVFSGSGGNPPRDRTPFRDSRGLSTMLPRRFLRVSDVVPHPVTTTNTILDTAGRLTAQKAIFTLSTERSSSSTLWIMSGF